MSYCPSYVPPQKGYLLAKGVNEQVGGVREDEKHRKYCHRGKYMNKQQVCYCIMKGISI